MKRNKWWSVALVLVALIAGIFLFVVLDDNNIESPGNLADSNFVLCAEDAIGEEFKTNIKPRLGVEFVDTTSILGQIQSADRDEANINCNFIRASIALGTGDRDVAIVYYSKILEEHTKDNSAWINVNLSSITPTALEQLKVETEKYLELLDSARLPDRYERGEVVR